MLKGTYKLEYMNKDGQVVSLTVEGIFMPRLIASLDKMGNIKLTKLKDTQC